MLWQWLLPTYADVCEWRSRSGGCIIRAPSKMIDIQFDLRMEDLVPGLKDMHALTGWQKLKRAIKTACFGPV